MERRHGLSLHQWEIARDFSLGMSSKEIGAKRSMSVSAVNNIKYRIGKFWGVRGKMGIARRVIDLEGRGVPVPQPVEISLVPGSLEAVVKASRDMGDR